MKAGILDFTKGCRLYAFLSAFFVILEVFLEILIPFITGKALDAGLMNNNYALFYKLSGVLILTAFLSLFCGAVSAITAARSGAIFAKNIRLGMFKHIQTFSFENIDKFTPGALIRRITGDVINLQHAYQMIIRVAVRLPIMIIFALVMSFRLSSSLARIYFIEIPLILFLIVVIMSVVLPLFKKGFGIIDRENIIIGENLRGIRTVKAMGGENGEIKKYDAVSKHHKAVFRKANVFLSLGGPLMRLIVYCSLIFFAYNGVGELTKGTLTTGGILSIFSYNTQILFSMMMFALTSSMVMMSAAGFFRIKEVLKEETMIQNPLQPIMDVEDGSIKAENVSFSYNVSSETMTLKNIDFDIKSGSVIGIIGPTGSGKSTLVSLFARLYDISEGKLYIGGKDIHEYDLSVLRDNVVIVLQKSTLFSGTLRSTLKWGNESATDSEIYEALDDACIGDLVSSFSDGLDHGVEQNGNNFSGGQKQRLCIARALLKKPKILVLDDSTSALDGRTEKKLLNILKNKRNEITKIIIAEKISSIEECDAIFVMNKGKIEAVGTHEELLKKSDYYKKLCELQDKNRRG